MRIFSKMLIAAVVLLTAGLVTAVAEDGGKPVTTDGFVCPVLGGQAGEHGNTEATPIVGIANGDYTVGGPDVTVPVHATNDDGAGSPGGDHASPGDPSYTAIWARN